MAELGVTWEVITSLNLVTELENLISRFIANPQDSKTRKELTEVMKNTSIRSNKTMTAIGSLQRSNKLKVGLYKEIVALCTKAENLQSAQGSVQENEQPQTTTPVPEVSIPAATHQEQHKVSETTQSEAATPQSNVVNLPNLLTEKEEQKLEEKKKKLEESLRKKLLAMENKIRERMQARAETRANRKGIKPEEAKELTDKKDALNRLKESSAGVRAEMKKLREEIKALKPKKVKLTAEEKAAKKAAKAAAKQAKSQAA